MPGRRVVVVGSINEDHVLKVDALPLRGETVIAVAATRASGGKGANQAVAAARCGVSTLLVGALGTDGQAVRLEGELRAHTVDTARLHRIPGSSGTAVVIVDRGGDNCIVVESGANAQLSPGFVLKSLADLGSGDVVLVQCEIPVAAVRAAIEHAGAVGATVVLNWSPSVPLPDDVVSHTTVLVVNRREAEALLGPPADSASDGRELATALSGRYGIDVVVTLGADGAVCRTGDRLTRIEAVPVTSAVIDSTGAGDTFAGTLAAALAAGVPLADAVRRACAAAADAVTALGAQPRAHTPQASSMPSGDPCTAVHPPTSPLGD